MHTALAAGANVLFLSMILSPPKGKIVFANAPFIASGCPVTSFSDSLTIYIDYNTIFCTFGQTSLSGVAL
jgi:hypothetical protein